MARVETGHIHLHSFILHHTGGCCETKSRGKNTQKHKYGCERTCTANKQTKEEAATALLHARNKHAEGKLNTFLTLMVSMGSR